MGWVESHAFLLRFFFSVKGKRGSAACVAGAKRKWHHRGAADFHPSHEHSGGLYQVTVKRRLEGLE